MRETLQAHVLQEIPFEPDIPWLMKRLRVKEGSANEAELRRTIEVARPLARPRAFFLVAYVGERGEDWVELAGVRFQSRVLRVNLEGTYRVFPYLATCGEEMQAWSDGIDDMLVGFWAEAVKEAALFCALRALFEHLQEHYQPGETASMSPGSLPDWPIQEQEPLFSLFGEHTGGIGVRLTDSLLMVPTKTVSGIRFPTQVAFESCQLCPREGCPGRRAIYDPDLYDSRYCRQNGGG
jgi:hypothetical protein